MRSALDALCTVIRGRRMLIVLANLEQVLDVAEELAALVARSEWSSVIEEPPEQSQRNWSARLTDRIVHRPL